MKIKSLFSSDKTVFSFEVFPPKKDTPIESIYKTLEKLAALSPDYISVTYGAGGNPANRVTCEVASHIKNELGIESMAHLTCINSARADVDYVLKDLSEHGVENILALRGDRNPEVTPKEDFRYANELVGYISGNKEATYDFGISAACYPECHSEAESARADLDRLRDKVDAGTDTLVSQLFFDNELFYTFVDHAREKGIAIPISAGIMPVTSRSQIERMVTMCGASIPAKLSRIMSKYQDNAKALTDAGIAYAVDQIVDLLSNGVQGIHLYTMNRPYVASKISEAVKSLL
jgi:methylenetetrahydrofolate reductase (NADPH)